MCYHSKDAHLIYVYGFGKSKALRCHIVLPGHIYNISFELKRKLFFHQLLLEVNDKNGQVMCAVRCKTFRTDGKSYKEIVPNYNRAEKEIQKLFRQKKV